MFKIRGSISKQKYILFAVFTFVAIFFAWLIVSANNLVDPIFLPSPVKVWRYVEKASADGSLWDNTWISVVRIFWGVFWSVLLGVPLGILVGTIPFAESIIRPICEFVRYMPVPAFVPLVMVWVGIGENAKIILLFIGIFFQMVLMVADDALSVSPDLLNSGYTLGATGWQTVTRILLPAMMPRTFDTLRMMIGWAWTYLVVAEMVAANSGLGYMIIKAQRFLKTDVIFCGILVIGLLGLITDRFMFLLNRRLFCWQEGK